MRFGADTNNVAKQALAHVRGGTTDQAPSTMELPVSTYLDEDRFYREFEVIFKRRPQALLLSIEIPEPGDYVATHVMGVPLLISRGEDGAARVFLNVCRHRGSKLCDEGKGKASRFICPYHAWTYNNTGKLVGVTGKTKFGEESVEGLNLTELYTVEAAGVVWACLTPGVKFDLDDWLGEARGELDRLELNQWFLYAKHIVPGPGWKVTMDGYLEAYHHDKVHAKTLSKHTVGNVIVHNVYGRHQRLTMARRNIKELENIPEADWKAGAYIRQIHCIFPNFQLSGILGGHCLVSQIFPGETPDTSITIQSILSAKKPETDEEREACEAFSQLANYAVQEEDYPIGFGIQEGLDSGANENFVIGRNEPGIQHYHNTVERVMREKGELLSAQ